MKRTLVLLTLLLGCSAPEDPEAPAASEPAEASEDPVSAKDPGTTTASGSSETTDPATPTPDDHAARVVAAADRDPADTALDAGRHPAELLRFFGVQPGMRVGEMMSGGGYSAELLARAVGPEGAVYGVNSPFILERFAAAPWAARLEKPVNSKVVRLDREFDAPFPDDVRDLDQVWSILVYHDFFWMETDRAAMNANIFAALKPGGIYAVVDHSAALGAGDRDVKTLHRGDEAIIRHEIEAAGFRLIEDADFLRNPDDDRAWNASPSAAGEQRGRSDRFVLKFRKPLLPEEPAE